jgi:hypothetical protein
MKKPTLSTSIFQYSSVVREEEVKESVYCTGLFFTNEAPEEVVLRGYPGIHTHGSWIVQSRM